MNKKSLFATLAIVMALLMITAFPIPTNAQAVRGPRTEDLIIRFYSDVEGAYAALKAGEIDMVGYEITKELFEDAIEDPHIQVAPVADMGMYEFDIQNNWTIKDYPEWRSPTSYWEMRAAMALLTDKDTVVRDCCGGFAERIDQPIAAPTKGWMNESYMAPNYPYEYDPLEAKTVLDSMFPEGTTDNPYYDPTFPGSVQHIRTYPEGHEKAGQDLDPLIICVRKDDRRRLCAGRMLYENLRKHGIPCNVIEADMSALYDRVMGDMNYHVYTGGWSLGRFPALTIYYLYHSMWCFPYGPNYVTGFNATGDPNYPDLDALLELAYYTPSYEAAVTATKNALGVFTEHCITVPLFSALSYWAYNDKVLGAVNMEGYGLEQGYTFMNAYKTDGSPLVYGLKSAPIAQNIIYSSWFYDRQVLDRYNMYGGIDVPPYNLAIDQAGWIQDWTEASVTTWTDPETGENKSKVTIWLRTDNYWVTPGTGDKGPVVDAYDWLFSAFVQFAFDDSWLASNYYPDCHHFKLFDYKEIDGELHPFGVEIYYDDFSYWFTYSASGAILPRHRWLVDPITNGLQTESFVEGTDVNTPGIVPLDYEVLWIENVTVDGTPLTMFEDYNLVKGERDGDIRLELMIYKDDIPDGATITVNYWGMGDAKGYWPGHLDPFDGDANADGKPDYIAEGCGMYYLYSYDKVGGVAHLKRNPYYYMETPALGEIDFAWKWGPRDSTRPAPDVPEGPRTGYYKVDIYDVVWACKAYGSTGNGIPSENWFVGADLVSPCCKVDIYDIVKVCGAYLTEFGHTPTDP